MNHLNADNLIRAGRDVTLPFTLMVESGGEVFPVTVREVLRLLPRRRIVAVAEKQGRQYLIKLFIGRMASRYARREVRGVGSIEASGARTPSLEWQGRLQAGGGCLVAFEFLEGAQSLMEAWDNAHHYDERLALMRQTIPVLATLHEGGVVQHDIHPENFLICHGDIYTIDGGGVARYARVPLPEHKSLDNLALFCAQFHHINDDLIPAVLRQYRQCRGWTNGEGRKLTGVIRARRSERKKDFVRKAFRECTRFSCQRAFSRFTVCDRAWDSPEMRRLLADPDAAMETGEPLKEGNTATVVKVQGPAGPLVVKRYNIKGFAHLVSRLFRRSRAWRSWENAMRLEFLGIKTVSPVALVEERLGPLRRRAYFITEFIEGPDASQLPTRPNPEADILSIVETLKGLSQAGVSHGDLKATNFLLGEDGVTLLDLDAMAEHRAPKSHVIAEEKDLRRFMLNWEGQPDIARRFSELLG
jgi:tRNA A-37 threonylcarbamoyl transferase component Bud32